MIEWVMAGGKGEEASGGSATVIQRVVREVGGGTTFSVLTKTNYLELGHAHAGEAQGAGPLDRR
jgi:hypothetical protein